MLLDSELRTIVGLYILKKEGFDRPYCENLYRQICHDSEEILSCVKLAADAIKNDRVQYYLNMTYNLESHDFKELENLQDSVCKIMTGTGDASDYNRLQNTPDIEYIKKTSTPIDVYNYAANSCKRYKCYNLMHTPFEVDGFKSKNLYVIGGYTGSGKSLACLNIALWLDTPAKIAYFNMENSDEETYNRLINHKRYVTKTAQHFDIYDGAKTFEEIKNIINDNKYDFVIIDQLSFIDSNHGVSSDNIRFEYKKYAQQLSELARSNDICIILACQLNRSYMSQFNNDDDFITNFYNLDDSCFAESSDITRPAQAAVITTVRYDVSKNTKLPVKHAYFVNVKQRSGSCDKCCRFDILPEYNNRKVM